MQPLALPGCRTRWRSGSWRSGVRREQRECSGMATTCWYRLHWIPGTGSVIQLIRRAYARSIRATAMLSPEAAIAARVAASSDPAEGNGGGDVVDEPAPGLLLRGGHAAHHQVHQPQAGGDG